jgi:hypothetical protein
MALGLEIELQEHLLRYLSRAEQLHEFEDWFTPLLWDMDAQNQGMRELFGSVSNLIAEFSRGDRTSESLEQELRELATAIRPFVGSVAPVKWIESEGVSVSEGSAWGGTATAVRPRRAYLAA